MHSHEDKLLLIIIGLEMLVIRIVLRHVPNQILWQIHLLCGLVQLLRSLHAFHATFEKAHAEVECSNCGLIGVHSEHLRHYSVKTFIIRA